MVTMHTVEGCVAIEVAIGVPPGRVWRAITTPEEMSRFITEFQSFSFEARLGGYLEFRRQAEGEGASVLRGRIVEFDPPRRLAYTWRWEGLDLKETLVTFTLEPSQGGTRVSLVHSGFTAEAPQFRLAHEVSWSAGAERLKNYVESNP
jgi:uncharacterized protein YndB with AHSA1/START domain